MDYPLTPHLARTPAKAPETPRKHPHRSLRRAGYAAAGLLIILLVIFFMLPVWISNEQGRTYVLSHISKRINGTLAIRNWQLGWFRGTTIEDLTLTLPDGKRLLHCPKIETDLTLWSLLWGNFDLGNTRIDSPRLTATRYRDGSNDFTRILLPSTTGPNPLGSIRGNIVCSNGFVQLAAEDTPAPITFSEVAAEIPIASHTAPIHLKATGTSMGTDANRPVTLVADLPAPSTWTDNPTALLSSLSVTAGSIPTATLARWLELDPRWQGSFGPTITVFSLETKPQPAAGSVVTLTASGQFGVVKANMSMVAQAGNIRLAPIEGDKRLTPLSANLTLSQPLVDLLTRVNPVFASLESTSEPIQFAFQDLSLDADHPGATTGTVLVILPNMVFRHNGFLRDAMKDPTNVEPVPAADAPLRANSVFSKLTLAGGRISYTDLGLTLSNRQRLVFSGSVGFDGTLDLILTLPLARDFGSTTLQIPVKGTVGKPRREYPSPIGPN